MPAIILPDRWRRQPNHAVRVREGLGISAAFIPTAGSLNLATGQLFTVGGDVVLDGSGSGLVRELRGGTAPQRYLSCPTVATSAGWTLAMVFQPRVMPTSNPEHLMGCCEFPGATTYDRTIAAPFGGGYKAYCYDAGGGIENYTANTGTVALGVTNVVSAISTGSILSIMVDRAISAPLSVANSGYTGYTSPEFCIGYPASSRGLDGLGFLCAIKAERAWTDGEREEFSQNPFGFAFEKPARILYFPSAGGGGYTLAGDSGTYALTGTAATLKAGRKLAADSGSYAITGTDVSLKLGRKLTAESGTYTVNGTDVSLKAGRKLAADSGTYSLTGTDVTLTYQPAGGYTLALDSGSYTLTGTTATLKASRKLTADSGTYALTGTAAGLAKGVRLTAESGAYTLTGSNVAFARTYVLTAESGAYTLTGTSAGLTWSGAPVVEAPTNGGPSIYGKPVFREKQFRKEYEEQVKRIEDEKRLARILREDEEITVIMALMAA